VYCQNTINAGFVNRMHEQMIRIKYGQFVSNLFIDNKDKRQSKIINLIASDPSPDAEGISRASVSM
jgi:hypothetical protein